MHGFVNEDQKALIESLFYVDEKVRVLKIVKKSSMIKNIKGSQSE